ncbi:AcrVA2 family anti-CRISPR protein [Escherichia coli]
MKKEINAQAERPLHVLRENFLNWPKDIWQRLDRFRNEFKAKNAMPQWSFAPRTVLVAAIRNGWSDADTDSRIRALLPSLQVFGAWRVGQGIYRFDSAVFDAVVDMDIPEIIPAETMYHLPEWAIWVETPGLKLEGSPVHGFFATIEQDTPGSEASMVLFVDSERKLEISKFVLRPGTPIKDCVMQSAMYGYFFSALDGLPPLEMATRQAELLKPYLNLLLFITTQASEITSSQEQRPSRALPKKTSKGERFFPPNAPMKWDVGLRIGAALKTESCPSGPSGDSQSSQGTVRPHIRRAHWHGYWLGPRDGDRTFDLRWLPPVAVNVKENEPLPAVLHPVK